MQTDSQSQGKHTPTITGLQGSWGGGRRSNSGMGGVVEPDFGCQIPRKSQTPRGRITQDLWLKDVGLGGAGKGKFTRQGGGRDAVRNLCLLLSSYTGRKWSVLPGGFQNKDLPEIFLTLR